MATSIEQILKEIQALSLDEQKKFLKQLPQTLQLDSDDFSWLKLAEPSFEFWDNAEDARYDEL